jgi:hypothetical protein
MWDYVDGRWNATQAASMYEGPLTAALARAYLEHAAKSRAKWIVLEDNDPAGYKSKRALAAKEAAGIVIDDLPKRSPDLNVLDYSLLQGTNRSEHWLRRRRQGLSSMTYPSARRT